jgi:acetyl-CoA acetyltransferase family protein
MSMSYDDVLILEGARTPFCTWAGGTKPDGQKGGALKPLDPFDLAASALKGAMARSGVGPEKIGKVIFGCAYHTGPHATYGARYVGYRAGIAPTVPGLAVTMACASGLQSLISSADAVLHGEAEFVAATGADCASLVARNVFIPSFNDMMCGGPIALAAQGTAKEDGFSRADQDRWSLESHKRASAARARGVFKEEIVPVTTPEGATFESDDAVIDAANPDVFAQSKILFENEQATAHNTHAVVDGGSAVILTNSQGAKQAKAVLGRLRGSSVSGVAGPDMARASVAAVDTLLPKIGWTKDSVDLWEINETFASQTLTAMKGLGVSEDRVNVNGGALALGHPFGGTGLRLVHTLLKELKRRGKKRGIAAICAGGGSGIALAVEA